MRPILFATALVAVLFLASDSEASGPAGFLGPGDGSVRIHPEQEGAPGSVTVVVEKEGWEIRLPGLAWPLKWKPESGTYEAEGMASPVGGEPRHIRIVVEFEVTPHPQGPPFADVQTFTLQWYVWDDATQSWVVQPGAATVSGPWSGPYGPGCPLLV